MFKKLFASLTALALCAACTNSSAASSSDNPFHKPDLNPSDTTDSGTTETIESSPESTDVPQFSNSSETYYSTSENFSDPYLPSITFYSDGTFIMIENLYEGMGQYEGTYTYDGNYYECTVTSKDFSGFAGDDVKLIEFARFDASLITLLTDLCGSRAKDIFSLNKGSQSSTTSSTTAQSDSWPEIYISSNDSFSDPYCPTLKLNQDGTFELTENLYEGMGHYKGHYTRQDINLTLYVEETDFMGFAGDDVTVIEFETMSKDVVQLMTDLCGSRRFDYWYLE